MQKKFKRILILFLVLTICFTVTVMACPTPEPASISPNMGINNETVTVNINGAYFHRSVFVKLTKQGQTDIMAKIVKRTATLIICTLDLKEVPAGKWNVVVTTIGTFTKKLRPFIMKDAFTIENGSPQITSVNPTKGSNNGIISLEVQGSSLRPGAAIKLSKDGQADILASNVVLSSAASLTGNVNLTGTAIGAYNVTVTNDDGKNATLCNAFSVEYPVPQIMSICPSEGDNAQILPLVVKGTGLRNGITVKLTKNGQSDIVASNVKVDNDNSLTCNVDLHGANEGSYTVLVTNDDGKTATLNESFSIKQHIEKSSIIDNSTITPKTDDSTATTKTDGSTVTPKTDDSTATTKTDGSTVTPKTDDSTATTKTDGSTVTPKTDDSTATTKTDGSTVTPKTDDSTATTKTDGSTVTPKTDDSTATTKTDGSIVTPKTDDSTATTKTDGSTVTPKTDDSNQQNQTTITDPNSLIKPIFFDFDRSALRSDQTVELDKDIIVIKTNSNLYIILGGHADERGSAQYNVKLSARRAEAVKKYLINSGVDASKIVVYAYGKEYPAKLGHDESSWWYNRRVDITLWETEPSKDQALIENINP